MINKKVLVYWGSVMGCRPGYHACKSNKFHHPTSKPFLSAHNGLATRVIPGWATNLSRGHVTAKQTGVHSIVLHGGEEKLLFWCQVIKFSLKSLSRLITDWWMDPSAGGQQQRYTKCLSIFKPLFPQQSLVDSRLSIFAVSYLSHSLCNEASEFSEPIFSHITNKSVEKLHSNGSSSKILMAQSAPSVSCFLRLFGAILGNEWQQTPTFIIFYLASATAPPTALSPLGCYINSKSKIILNKMPLLLGRSLHSNFRQLLQKLQNGSKVDLLRRK